MQIVLEGLQKSAAFFAGHPLVGFAFVLLLLFVLYRLHRIRRCWGCRKRVRRWHEIEVVRANRELVGRCTTMRECTNGARDKRGRLVCALFGQEVSEKSYPVHFSPLRLWILRHWQKFYNDIRFY